MSRSLAWLLLPVLLIVLIGAAFLVSDPLRPFSAGVPPVEELTVERTVLDGEGIALLVRAGGTEPVQIAQVQVDGAYWTFVQDPAGPLPRLSTAWLRLPYPWVQGETHHLVMLSRTGIPFEHTIDVAVPTPTRGSLGALGLVGLFVGIVPVALGMLFYPALKAGGRSAFDFALALTIGLLFLSWSTRSKRRSSWRGKQHQASTLLPWSGYSRRSPRRCCLPLGAEREAGSTCQRPCRQSSRRADSPTGRKLLGSRSRRRRSCRAHHNAGMPRNVQSCGRIAKHRRERDDPDRKQQPAIRFDGMADAERQQRDRRTLGGSF